jgi:putative ABC transport system permease protein
VIDVAMEDVSVPVMGIESQAGQVGPVIIDGRAPSATGEIALGRETLRQLGRQVGDRVDVAPVDGGRSTELSIVGMTVFPAGDHDFPGALGEGGVMTLPGLAQVGEAPRHIYLVRFADGLDPEAVLAELQEQGPGNYGPASDPEIDNLDQASTVIPGLVAAIAVLAVVALGHALTATVRRRRRDLALFGSLGMRPRQLTAIVLCQAVAIATIATAVGTPLGLVVAQSTWGAVARGVGVADDITIAVPWGFATLVVCVLATSLLLAAGPALSAARTRVADALRAE